ncbi:histone PARylation factor 1 [Aphis craccivora]|uniref:Histone PARylation factor 1 n=1 Tax=Aphis craccivora TaxID=307492 RepID=A0A6G0Y9N8_APHCR|nr:histone PARylation factor 1 [Aphis craccivora]
MEKFFAYQKDSREPCKYGRKCFQTNKEHTDKYKHPPTKDDIKVDNKKMTRKRDLKGKLKSSNKTNGESSNSNNSYRPNEESHNSNEINDMEVPERPEQTISTSNSEPSSSNQQNLTEYAVPSMRQHSQQQQQLLLTNSTLEDCSVDDGIVPSTPTLFTPRRLDGETVSSPHVPSSNQIQRFTFVGESQPSQTPDLNDREQPEDLSVQDVTDFDCFKKKISELFLIKEMPKEFYDLWSFCKRQCSAHPEDALLPVGLKLVGPYDVLAGHMNGFNANDVEKTVLHWRYYYDPPEFQTILASTTSEFHIGYYRDVPLEFPVCVVSNDSSKNCIIQNLGKSLFQVLKKHLLCLDSKIANTFKKKLHDYEQRKVTETLLGRQCLPVTKTFHKAGIVVPYDRKTDVGYRPLSESEHNLKKILKSYNEASESKKIEVMNKLQPIINYANIASDECDFGTGFELGIDFFCDGNPDLHRICKQLLVTAYSLLRRPQFATIIKVIITNFSIEHSKPQRL